MNTKLETWEGKSKNYLPAQSKTVELEIVGRKVSPRENYEKNSNSERKKKKNSGLVENFPDMPQIKMSFKK